MNKVSVIIPMYNSEKTIARALDSVLNQTITPYEIIVIDDGSKDDSYSIVQNYINQNQNFRFLLLKKANGGVSSARNAGLKNATGSLIAFLDSDDEWLLDKLERQLFFFDSQKDFGFIGGLIYIPKQGVRGNFIEISLADLIFKNYFQPSTVIFKKEVFDIVGFFDETQRYAEEGNFFMRIADKFRCGLLMEQVVLYDQGKNGFGESGLSSNLVEMEKGELKNLKFAYKNNYISYVKYSFAVVYSVLKYLRRILIVKGRNL